MLNKEKYAGEIADIALADGIIAIRDNEPFMCDCISCHKCNYDYCDIDKVQKWANSEYKEDILTKKEKGYLRTVIAPFREKISFIKKKGYDSLMESGYKKRMEYLYISLGTEGMVMLAPNEKGTTYKGMSLGRQYTIKELGL